jgi:hypothetical protein
MDDFDQFPSSVPLISESEKNKIYLLRTILSGNLSNGKNTLSNYCAII